MSVPSRVLHIVAGALAGLVVACADSAPIVGTESKCPCFPAPPTATPIDHGAATVYLGPDSIYRQRQGYPTDIPSQYRLYADGSFVLLLGTSLGYTGRYVRADSVITFVWDGWSGAGPWGATGIVRGDELTVKYNLVMLLTDFMDGTYRREGDAR